MNLCPALASRVVKASSAASHAVIRCDAELRRARRVVDDAGNDDAAALAALDASVRCDAASLAALQAATRYEALAQGANANHSADATTPAQRARAAAARCDVDGAAAASRAANAFAESCVAACGDAERLTLAAGEAAARCVLARDDAATALLVARQAKAATRRHEKASRESADSHKEACKDAAAAALAVREGAVRCAAASRRAVLAALTARKIASRCEAAGGDGAMVAAATAREAADRCVAARADAAAAGDDVADAAASLAVPLVEAHVAVLAVPIAPAAAGAGADRPGKAAADLAVPLAEAGLAVPLAHAAALKAREAAAGCDAALADPVADADKEFVDKMRGWLMTVATLFVGIAFQALLHPPDGMSFDSSYILVTKNARNWKAGSGAPSPAPNLAPSSAATVANVTSPDDWLGACLYLVFNTSIMAFALIALVSLLTMKKVTSTHSLIEIKAMAKILAIAVVGSVVTGTSRILGVQLGILVIFGIYAFVLVLIPSIIIRRCLTSGD